jgi:hypothetical protein
MSGLFCVPEKSPPPVLVPPRDPKPPPRVLVPVPKPVVGLAPNRPPPVDVVVPKRQQKSYKFSEISQGWRSSVR